MKLELKIPPIIVMIFCMLLMYFFSKVFISFNSDFLFQIFIAIETLISGLVVIVAGIYVLQEKETTLSPLKPESSSKLVTHGIYKFTRNPIYFGMVIVMLAWLIYLGNIINIIPIIIFVLYMNRFQIIPEEKILEKLFGKDYLVYKSKVRRWL